MRKNNKIFLLLIVFDKIKKERENKMKVITIKQPFATLIAEGLKEYEFRTWKTKYRGPILIHAGKGIDKSAMKRYEHLNLEYPTSCIIAQSHLIDCIKIDDKTREFLQKKNPEIYHSIIKHTDWEGYGFQLEHTKKIVPITVNGNISLWNYDLKEKEIG